MGGVVVHSEHQCGEKHTGRMTVMLPFLSLHLPLMKIEGQKLCTSLFVQL